MELAYQVRYLTRQGVMLAEETRDVNMGHEEVRSRPQGLWHLRPCWVCAAGPRNACIALLVLVVILLVGMEGDAQWAPLWGQFPTPPTDPPRISIRRHISASQPAAFSQSGTGEVSIWERESPPSRQGWHR